MRDDASESVRWHALSIDEVIDRLDTVAGEPEHDFTPLAYALVLDSDAVVGDDGTVVGDPTDAALVVLAAQLGVDAEESRRALPRRTGRSCMRPTRRPSISRWPAATMATCGKMWRTPGHPGKGP